VCRPPPRTGLRKQSSHRISTGTRHDLPRKLTRSHTEGVDVLYDARWIGDHGIGRFAGELQKALPGLTPFKASRRPWHPLDPVLLTLALWRRNPRVFFSPGYNAPIGWPKPFVFTLHDLNHLRVPDNSNDAKRAYYKYLIQPACRRAVLVLTVSEYSKGEIVAWSKVRDEKIVNVGNGVGPPFTAEGTKHQPGYPYLLYVGSRKAYKNLSRLLEAYSRAGVRSDVRLVLAGLPDPRTVAEIKRLQLQGDVVFTDTAADKDLSDLYRGALAFAFPSLYEGFGLPPLEAMACGTPVLTSNVCSLPEVVGDAGLLVDPLQVEAIADGIRQLVHDGGLRARLREKGLLRARRFSWEATARKTWAALQFASTAD
jgi:glycosyltransferase involved in cell wall biosynthesis